MAKHIPYSCSSRDDSLIEALCSAIDEGDSSPDVNDFDEDSFLRDIKAGWNENNTLKQ